MYKRLEEKQVVLGRLRVIYMHQRAKYIKQNGDYVRVSSLKPAKPSAMPAKPSAMQAKGGAVSPAASSSSPETFMLQDLPEEEQHRAMKQLIRDSKEGLNINETSSVASVARSNKHFNSLLIQMKTELVSKLDTKKFNHAGIAYHLLFTQDGSQLISIATDNTIKVWNIRGEQNEPIRTLSKYTDDILAISISPNGALVAFSRLNSNPAIWNFQEEKELCELNDPSLQGPEHDFAIMAFNPKGTLLVTSGYELNGGHPRIHLWEIKQNKCSKQQELTGHPNGDNIIQMLFSPDGRTLATLSNNKPPFMLQLEYNITYNIRLWRKKNNEWENIAFYSNSYIYKVINIDNHVSMCFSPDSRSLMVSTGKTIKLLRINDEGNALTESASFEAHNKDITSVAYSPDGKTLAVGCGGTDCTVKLWHFYNNQWKNIITFAGHKASVASLAFSPDGSMLASGASVKPMRGYSATQSGLTILRNIRPVIDFYKD